jgi:hypothetical protein
LWKFKKVPRKYFQKLLEAIKKRKTQIHKKFRAENFFMLLKLFKVLEGSKKCHRFSIQKSIYIL